MSGPVKRMLDQIYLQKIRFSDFILVINPGGYIGLGGWDEIFYAVSLKLPVFSLAYIPEECMLALKDLIEFENS